MDGLGHLGLNSLEEPWLKKTVIGQYHHLASPVTNCVGADSQIVLGLIYNMEATVSL